MCCTWPPAMGVPSARYLYVVVLEEGAINIDQRDPLGLMVAAKQGSSRVASILLGRRANVSIAAENEITALHPFPLHTDTSP